MDKPKIDWYQAFVTGENLDKFPPDLRAAAQVMLREEIEGLDGKNSFEESQRCVVAGLVRFHDFCDALTTAEVNTVAKLICSAYLLGRQALIVEIQDDPVRILAHIMIG